MKNCVNCGAQIDEGSKFCPNCGTKCDSMEPENSSNQSSYPSSDPAFKDPDPAFEYTDSSSSQSSGDYSGSSADLYPMKWHKFLMVVMIIGAIYTIASGIIQMTGHQYTREGSSPEYIYAVFPGMKTCDLVYGVMMIAIGVFQFIVRNRLNQFRANGPSSLRLLYILSIAAGVFYLIWASSVTRVNLFTANNLGNVIGSVVMMIINGVYYSKRSPLFVN